MASSNKKVSVITRHAVSNYGSVLQSYALQKAINSLGCECEIVDYVRDDEHYRNITSALIKKSRWNKNILTRTIYKLIQSPEYIIMGKAFEKYRNEILNTTPITYSSLEQLKTNPPVADVYCTGSDQVWGAVGDNEIDGAYFLDYALGKKKIAYAGSFGKTDKIDADSPICSWLKDYDYITVRESSAKSLINNLGIDNVSQVLDPTLLLNKEQWGEFINKDIKGDYVLLYQLHSNADMDRYAKEFAKKMNIRLIRITPLLHRVFKGGRAVYLPDISTFLSYIKNAKYMITDSFHGTAFAINFNTPFVDILPGETKTRNQSILELTGLTGQILNDYNDFCFVNKVPDFTNANKIIDEERRASYEILKKMIND